MTIAYDPKPSVLKTPGNRYETPGLREITDEIIHDEESVQEPETLLDPDEDWIRMYTGKKMEENY